MKVDKDTRHSAVELCLPRVPFDVTSQLLLDVSKKQRPTTLWLTRTILTTHA